MGGTLATQRAQLLHSIQAQSMLIKTLEAQVASSGNQFKQAQVLYQSRQSWLNARQEINRQPEFQVMSAPFSGVVYSTEREQGEQVNQLEPVLTVLDCNDLWIETVVRANEARRIDTQKPVSVHMSGYSQAVTGEVDLIQPISSIQGVEERSKLMQVQALLPAIPATLVGQPLVRVTVRIPPPPEHEQSERFCGIGQSVSLTFSKKSAASI
jgi:multidrug resistance efflux pump